MQQPAHKGDRFKEIAGPRGTPTWTVSKVNRADQWIQMTRPVDRFATYEWRLAWSTFSELRRTGKLTRVP